MSGRPSTDMPSEDESRSQALEANAAAHRQRRSVFWMNTVSGTGKDLTAFVVRHFVASHDVLLSVVDSTIIQVAVSCTIHIK